MIPPIVLKRINEAIDKVFFDFKNDEEILFKDDQEKRIFKYEIKEDLREWDFDSYCIYNGCKKLSVKRSHTIQKASSIKSISENNHTLRPHFNRRSEKIELEEISDEKASTFPGFCLEHERLFEGFESRGELSEESHYKLQIYRTVCREIVKKRRNLSALESRYKQYLNYRSFKFKQLVIQDLGDEFLQKNNLIVKSLNIKTPDFRKFTIEKKIKELKSDLEGFLFRFENGILNDILKNKARYITAKLYTLSDLVIPVALAGRGNFKTKKNDKVKNIDVILNVLPFQSYTLVMIASLISNKVELDLYTRNFENYIVLINAIESWMIYGTDHWFIKPSVWNKIKKTNQQKILQDLCDTSVNISEDYQLTIFNDIKRQIILFLEQNSNEISGYMQDVLIKEKVKLSD